MIVRTARWLATAAALTLLAGCAQPALELTAAATPIRTEAQPSLPSSAQVAGMLLTRADLPDGFSTTAAAADGQNDADSAVQGCGASSNVPHVDGAAVFNNGWTTFVAEGLRVSTAADAARAIQALRTGGCGVRSTSGLAIEPLPFPRLGDESVALQATGNAVITSVDTHIVGIRHGDVLIVVTHTVMGDADAQTTESVARAALARVVARR